MKLIDILFRRLSAVISIIIIILAVQTLLGDSLSKWGILQEVIVKSPKSSKAV